MDDLIYDLRIALGCCVAGAVLMGTAYVLLEWWERKSLRGARPTRADIDAALLAGDLVTADAVPPDMAAMPCPPWLCIGPACRGHETREGCEFHARTRHFKRDLAAWAACSPEHAFTNQ